MPLLKVSTHVSLCSLGALTIGRNFHYPYQHFFPLPQSFPNCSYLRDVKTRDRLVKGDTIYICFQPVVSQFSACRQQVFSQLSASFSLHCISCQSVFSQLSLSCKSVFNQLSPCCLSVVSQFSACCQQVFSQLSASFSLHCISCQPVFSLMLGSFQSDVS